MQSHGRRAYDQPANDPPRRAVFRVAIAFTTFLATPLPDIAAAQAESGTASLTVSRQFAFDIPAQPLATALEAYSSVTGIETLYDSAVARERRSAAVRGSFTAVDALRMLLSGTLLSARLIAQDAVTIELPPAAAQPAMGPAPDKSAYRLYYSLIQAGLERAFCKDDQLRPGSYRAVLKFTIAANGQIRQPSLVGTTGNDDRDRIIARALDGVSIGRPPPADLQQPIMMVILPQSSGHVPKCASIH